MRRLGVLFVFIFLSLSTMIGQTININGIEYEYSINYKYINGRKVIISESAGVKSASTSLSGNVTIPSQITYKGKSIAVTVILRNAFEDCGQITSIIVPDGVGSIHDYAFRNCTGLTSIKLPSEMSGIGNGAFYNCSSLISVELPQIKNGWGGFEGLSNDMFNGCSSLVYVKIPSTIQGIEERVFKNCKSLTDIFCYPTKVPSYSENAFDGTNRMKIKIHVPNAAITQYQNSAWKKFKSIDTNMTRPLVQKQVIKQKTNSSDIEAIDMGGTVEWANMNMEASSPQEPGGIFAWGETHSKKEFSPKNYSEPKFPGWAGYEIYENGLKGTKYDAARMVWGDSWRMPTESEFRDLIYNCKQIIHSRTNYVEFIAPNGNRLFFPYFKSTNITKFGYDNFYWTLNTDSQAPICFNFSETGYDISGHDAVYSSSEPHRRSYFSITNKGGHYGGLIRPVRDKKKKSERNDINNANETTFVKEKPKTSNGYWYVFGTRKELEEQRIITGNTVISEPINRGYFTKINKDLDKEVYLYSSNAQILTRHPTNSYKLVLNDNRKYKLVITNPDSFWSESNFLVILVN